MTGFECLTGYTVLGDKSATHQLAVCRPEAMVSPGEYDTGTMLEYVTLKWMQQDSDMQVKPCVQVCVRHIQYYSTYSSSQYLCFILTVQPGKV